ncbi:MAG: FliG C-terminal domain-containing protein [bacterium]
MEERCALLGKILVGLIGRYIGAALRRKVSTSLEGAEEGVDPETLGDYGVLISRKFGGESGLDLLLFSSDDVATLFDDVFKGREFDRSRDIWSERVDFWRKLIFLAGERGFEVLASLIGGKMRSSFCDGRRLRSPLDYEILSSLLGREEVWAFLCGLEVEGIAKIHFLELISKCWIDRAAEEVVKREKQILLRGMLGERKEVPSVHNILERPLNWEGAFLDRDEDLVFGRILLAGEGVSPVRISPVRPAALREEDGVILANVEYKGDLNGRILFAFPHDPVKELDVPLKELLESALTESSKAWGETLEVEGLEIDLASLGFANFSDSAPSGQAEEGLLARVDYKWKLGEGDKIASTRGYVPAHFLAAMDRLLVRQTSMSALPRSNGFQVPPMDGERLLLSWLDLNWHFSRAICAEEATLSRELANVRSRIFPSRYVRILSLESMLEISDRDLRIIIQEMVAQGLGDYALVIVMSQMSRELQEKFYRNMSASGAQIVRENMAVYAPEPRRVAFVQGKMIELIRDLHSDGRISLPGTFARQVEAIARKMEAERNEEVERILGSPLFDEIISRISDATMRCLMREVGRDDVGIALMGANPRTEARFLQNMSRNAASMMKDDREAWERRIESEAEKKHRIAEARKEVLRSLVWAHTKHNPSPSEMMDLADTIIEAVEGGRDRDLLRDVLGWAYLCRERYRDALYSLARVMDFRREDKRLIHFFSMAKERLSRERQMRRIELRKGIKINHE